MIFDMVILYVILINLTEMECILLLLKELSITLFMCFRIYYFGKIKMIFRGDENLKNIFIANVIVHRYSNLIKTDKYF